MLLSAHSSTIKAYPTSPTGLNPLQLREGLSSERALLFETAGDNSKEEPKIFDETKEEQWRNSTSGEAGKVFIVPTLQMNVINYREDEHTFLSLLKKLVMGKENSKLKLATGYLNL